MNTRIQQFLQAENLNQSQLADTLGVARASISHIVAGRNKPGFDFIESMALHYPTLNLEWLITGNGEMYKASEMATNMASNKSDITEQLLFEDDSVQNEPVETPAAAQPVKPSVTQQARPGGNTAFDQITEPAKAGQTGRIVSQKSEKTIDKFIVFYSDGTYQEFLPAQK